MNSRPTSQLSLADQLTAFLLSLAIIAAFGICGALIYQLAVFMGWAQ